MYDTLISKAVGIITAHLDSQANWYTKNESPNIFDISIHGHIMKTFGFGF